ncbi:AraC family transcriptional regulator [Ferrimonas kyonanensis]|uniref:AraC family transcriptional regulator n=1 Tax=Ferrimonas kyonanensis TaxID=364763 RepID=UPI0004840BC5|nr:AraC family transcriptional regulator [Ferrimonas kyonanensis]
MENSKIKALIETLTPSEGLTETGIDGVQLFRISNTFTRSPAVYSPGICLLVSGSKVAYLGSEAHSYDQSNYFCCTMAMPIEAEIPFASEQEPVLGVLISLDCGVLTELAIEFEAANLPTQVAMASEFVPGLAVVKKDARFDEAAYRLLQLVGDRSATGLLGRGRLRELFYLVLTGGAGQMVRQAYGVGNQIAKSIRYVREHLSNTITIDDMASQAGMSRAVFHRKFKGATTLSPLQFVKSLRLNDAAMRVASGVTISEAATLSGYSSSSQFSREFKRQYGASPREWIQISVQQLGDTQSI